MISANKIIDGVCEALNSEFGDDYEVYTEEIEQGLKEPCFSVALLKPSTTPFLGKRYYKTNFFCIHYFPKSETDAKSECFDVAERLTNCLEYIIVDGDLTRGTEMNSEQVDGVLSFFVNYDMFVIKEQGKEPTMENIVQTFGVS